MCPRLLEVIVGDIFNVKRCCKTSRVKIWSLYRQRIGLHMYMYNVTLDQLPVCLEHFQTVYKASRAFSAKAGLLFKDGQVEITKVAKRREKKTMPVDGKLQIHRSTKPASWPIMGIVCERGDRFDWTKGPRTHKNTRVLSQIITSTGCRRVVAALASLCYFVCGPHVIGL